MAWVTYQLHGGIVHIHVAEFHFGVFLGNLGDNLTPETADVKHVCFIHRADFFSSLHGSFERNMGNTPDFVFIVNHRIEARAPAVTDFNAGGLSKINTACQFPHNHDIKPFIHNILA